MNPEFIKYLEAIGMKSPLIDRVKKIYEFYEEILPNEITDIFVEDYLDGNGSRNYQNLWFFSEKYIMESKSFISTDDFDITPIKSKIEYVRVRKQYYDIGHTTEKSRLNLEFGMDTKAGGDVKASKENCEYLWKIATKYVYHNLKK